MPFGSIKHCKRLQKTKKELQGIDGRHSKGVPEKNCEELQGSGLELGLRLELGNTK